MTEVDFQREAAELIAKAQAIHEQIGLAHNDAMYLPLYEVRHDLHEASRAIKRVVDGLRSVLPKIEPSEPI